MSARGANIGGALAQGASNWGQILMALMARRDDQQRFDAESAYRTSRDTAQDTHNTELRNIASNRANAELEMSGYVPSHFSQSQNFAPVSTPSPSVDMGLGMAKGGSVRGMGERLMEMTAPQKLAPSSSMAFVPGAYDPARDAQVQQKLALASAVPPRQPLAKLSRGGVTVEDVPIEQASGILAGLPEDAPYNPSTDPIVARARYMQSQGLARDPNAPPPERPSQAGPTSDFGRKALFMLEGAENAVKTLETYNPGFQDEVAQNTPLVGRFMVSQEGQVARQAAMTLADAYLRLTTGANYNQDEVKKTAEQMIADADDKPGTKNAKRMRRDEIIRAIRQAAGAPAPVARPPELPATPPTLGGRATASGNPWRR